MFSIIIPTWNNLEFIRLCYDSIQKNSSYRHQVILHINDGSDGTLQWARENNIMHTYSEKNIGICKAVNLAASHSELDYVVYMNDDMYVCLEWDVHLVNAIKEIDDECFMLSATMIEPRDTGNPCVIMGDYGNSVENFAEKRLLDEYKKTVKSDWNGATWPPTLVHKKYWNLVGGYSIEFSPGMSSDDDFSRKMWEAGCRIFKGIGDSRVYHFQSKSTLRIKKNNGRKQFLLKWGINQSAFNKYFIKRGIPYSGRLQEPNDSILMKEKTRGWLKKKLFY